MNPSSSSYFFFFFILSHKLSAISPQVDLGFNMNILDIGGGFTGSDFQLKQVRGEPLKRPGTSCCLLGAQVDLQPLNYYLFIYFLLSHSQVESAVRPLLDAYFSPLSGVQVLAQPGSFYVSSAFSLAVSVIGKELVNRGWDSLAPGERSL